MVLRRIKAGTKDIDLVVDTTEDRQILIDVLLTMGYTKAHLAPEYAGMEGVLLRRAQSVGVDIFVRVIMEKFAMTESMKSRADGPHQFGNLELYHCANEDIFLLKSITDRPDDDDDILVLLGTDLDAEILKEELRVQAKRSGKPWPHIVQRELQKIEERKKVPIPIKDFIVD